MVDILAAPHRTKADHALRTLTAISIAHWLSHFHIFTLPMLFPFLKAQLGVGYIELGFALTVFAVVSALTQAPLGYVVDHIGARKILLLGLCLQSYIFRYCGGVLFLVLGGWFIWTTYSDLGQRSALLDSYWFILGALYLFDGALLLFSNLLQLNLSACVPRSRSTRRVLERCS